MKQDINESLNKEERENLRRCERIVEQGLTTFTEVGNALLEIRDKRLYRETHRSFGAYLRERWQLKRSRAHQLIDAAKVAANLSTTVDTPPPTNERQVRALSPLPPEEQQAAWRDAVEHAPNGTPTSKDVEAAVRAKRNPVPKKHQTAQTARATAEHRITTPTGEGRSDVKEPQTVRTSETPLRLIQRLSTALEDIRQASASDAESRNVYIDGLRKHKKDVATVLKVLLTPATPGVTEQGRRISVCAV